MVNESVIKHLSYSGLRLYQECPFKFYLKYVEKIGDTRTIPEFEIGGGFHKGMQVLYETGSFENAKEKFRSSLGQLISDSSIDVLTENMFFYSNNYLGNYLDRKVGTEVRFSINIPNVPVPVIGYLDLLLKDGFIDHKTTSEYNLRKAFDKKQFATYSLWFFMKYKVLPPVTEAHLFHKTKKGDYGVNVLKQEITKDDVNVMLLEYVQLWQDLKNNRFTPNLNAWKKEDPLYDLMIEYAEQQI